jgi:hypothetical protein
MPYAIIRHAKIKTLGNLAASAQHTFRERDTPNADPKLTPQNQHLGATNTAELLERFQQNLPDRLRKNGVLALEYLCTASPEWWQAASKEQRTAFFQRSLDFLRERHGKDNVLYAGTQVDESTPHLVAYVIPKDDKGRMNAAYFVDGRKKLNELQTAFADQVADLGLKRGIEGSKAKHEQVKRHYGLVMRGEALDAPEIGVIDEMSMVLGKPTKNAQKAIETRQALLVRADAWECRQKAVKQREEALARREMAVLERESLVGHREEMARNADWRLERSVELSQRTENELNQRIDQLEKQLKKEQSDKLMFMKVRDQALERARAAEKLLGKDSGLDLSL